ncbi:hypothetical protein [uncultured Eubacterium sp.]|uniref:hypothetical protein n=1 Tax=uncultured Eubacterium sp. TaxID=165185 RepID=UPI0015BFC81D|nr:hypothetical protein [uncultured Eubacterium sp.]
MDVRYRMKDVVDLSRNACQDFLKMIIFDGWQQVVYNKAQYEINNNGRCKDKYISAYEKMREIGVENYSVDDMDITFISEIVHGCRDIVPTNEKTRKCIEQLTEDRNLTNHSNGNEENEELYLRGLLALCNLKKFITTVDRFEKTIDDEKRIEYRRSYSKKIEDLKGILDEERICLIQKHKNIKEDIQKILNCEDEKQRTKVWLDLLNVYSEKYIKLGNDHDTYYEFMVEASNVGIKEAHSQAAYYFLFMIKDYAEGERRLYLLYNSFDVLPPYESKHIIDTLNQYIFQGNELTKGMEELITLIIKQGNPVRENENGFFVWSKMVNN